MKNRAPQIYTYEGERFYARMERAENLRAGDVIVHLDGTPQRIVSAGAHKDGFGWAYDFAFGGDVVPFAARGEELFRKLHAIGEDHPSSLQGP